MRNLTNTVLRHLRSEWRRVLAIHLLYTGLTLILFAPLLSVLVRLVLKLSGKPAAADMELVSLALSPIGLVALVVFLTATMMISVFELASLMALGVGRTDASHVDVLTALFFALKRVTRIFQFAALLVLRLLIVVTPFLLGAAVVAWLLLDDYDINYYLAVQPMEFWVTVVLVSLILAMMTILLVRRLIAWSLALPLVLFVDTRPSESFAASTVLTRQNSRLILWSLLVWGAVAVLLGALITFMVRWLAASVLPQFMDTVTALAAVVGSLAALWLVASAAAAAMAAGSLAFLVAALARRLASRFRNITLVPGTQPMFRLAMRQRRWLLTAFAALVGGAAWLSHALLDEIEIPDDVQIIAHRGAAGAAPENTLAAVRQAITDGADWIEIDVQETADGEVVVIHDSDFMKLAGIDQKVWETRSEQLADIDVGSWFAPRFADERVPTLAAVLDEVKGRSRLLIELKYYGHDQQLEQRVIDLIEAAGMQAETMIMSLDYAGIQRVRALRPEWKVGLLSARAVGDLTRLDADFLAVNIALARPALVQGAHDAGQALLVWTVNDALAMSQMASLGVDAILTDEPALGRDVLIARAQLNPAQRLLLYIAPALGFDAPSLGLDSNDAAVGQGRENSELSLHQRLHDRIAKPGTKLAAFTTDGCSGGLSVGWDLLARKVGSFRERHGARPPWENCCITHDRAYHEGGGAGLTVRQSYDMREQADARLRDCVLATADERAEQLGEDYGLDKGEVTKLYRNIADSMYAAVRMGGMPCTGLSWRWGYGWPQCDWSRRDNAHGSKPPPESQEETQE